MVKVIYFITCNNCALLNEARYNDCKNLVGYDI